MSAWLNVFFALRRNRAHGTSLAIATGRACGHARHTPLTGPGVGGFRVAGRELGFGAGVQRGETRVVLPPGGPFGCVFEVDSDLAL